MLDHLQSAVLLMEGGLLGDFFVLVRSGLHSTRLLMDGPR